VLDLQKDPLPATIRSFDVSLAGSSAHRKHFRYGG